MPGTAHCAFLLQQYRGEGFCCRHRRRTQRTHPGAIGRISQRKEHKPECRTQARQADTKELPGRKSRIYPYAGCLYSPKPTRGNSQRCQSGFVRLDTIPMRLPINRTAKGASAWTLGLAKSDANLEVAERENSVILYESDYKTRYAGLIPIPPSPTLSWSRADKYIAKHTSGITCTKAFPATPAAG